MEPLRVEFDLTGEAILSGFPLHLDALVAYAVTEEALQEGRADDTPIRQVANDLPLARIERDEGWVWAASALERTEVLQHGIRGWIRTTDIDQMARDAGGILNLQGTPPYKPFQHVLSTGSGHFRNYKIHTPTQQIVRMTAWCIGDEEQLYDLLSPESGFVKSIGKMRRNGHGRILEMRIIPDPEAETRWTRRILPWKAPGTVPIEAVTHPPYWDITQRQMAWVDPAIF